MDKGDEKRSIIMNPRVEFAPVNIKGKTGIDVVIHSEEATLADYLSALEEYIERGTYQRVRAETGKCEGCDVCCQERVPLTSLDVLVLQKGLAPGLPLGEFFKRFTNVCVSGPVVDITLARQSDGKCIFLNRDTRRCLNYNERPLVCRTYICTPLTSRARKLRDAIVNTGEDELVRLWFRSSVKDGLVIHEAWDPEINEEDWLENAWTGKITPQQVYLKDIIPSSLWNELYKKGE
jgi:hypothetical protein